MTQTKDPNRVTLTNVVSLQTELERAMEEAERLREMLTKCPQTRLGSKWAYVNNHGPLDGHKVGFGQMVVLCDLNGFKGAQDAHRHGHLHGNRILEEFAGWLLDHTRSGCDRSPDEIAYRVGGDEFLVWCKDREAAKRIRDRVRAWRSLTDPIVTCSAGMGPDYKTADLNCYLNKKERKAERATASPPSRIRQWAAACWQGLLRAARHRPAS